MKSNFLYKSIFFRTFFNCFCKKGKQHSNERFFYLFLSNSKNVSLYRKNFLITTKKKFFLFVFLLLEYMYIYRSAIMLKLIRRGKFLYKVPYRIIKKNLYRYSLRNLLKTKQLKNYAPSPVRILLDKEDFVLTVFENRLLTHYRWYQSKKYN